MNRVDKVCEKHDISYSKTKYINERHIADKELLDDLDNIENRTIGERFERTIIKKIIKAKKTFVLGLMYCVKFKNKTGTENYKEVISSNNEKMAKGTCIKCGSKKSPFLG